MSWLRSNRRSAWIIGLSLLIPAVLYLNLLFSLLGLYRDYQSDIDRLQPRIGRLYGLMDYEEQLRESAGKVDRQVVSMVYPVTVDRATVSAALQKDVRQILVDAGLSVSNSQVLPVREENAFDYIGLKLTVTGELAGLDAAMIAIAGYTPRLLVESLDVWPARVNRRASKVKQQAKQQAKQQTISATLQLLALRAAR